jgi:hypothetical protein
MKDIVELTRLAKELTRWMIEMSSANENKGYKFRLEYTETDFYEDDKDERNKYDMKYAAYGDTAKGYCTLIGWVKRWII